MVEYEHMNTPRFQQEVIGEYRISFIPVETTNCEATMRK
jgi:hypothetical protein